MSSKEIEDALLSDTAIAEAAVVGTPDDVLGEAIKAFIVLRESSTRTSQEVIRSCMATLPLYKVPKFVEILEELPKSSSGKVLKKTLKDLK